jgi:hypothetical protein
MSVLTVLQRRIKRMARAVQEAIEEEEDRVDEDEDAVKDEDEDEDGDRGKTKKRGRKARSRRTPPVETGDDDLL